MKRVTLLVKDITSEPDRDGELEITPLDGPSFYVRAAEVVAVEDEPLPTEPGERFWGSCGLIAKPQWWFVQGLSDEVKTSIVYVPATGGSVLNQDGCLAGSLAASTYGLVRLPDPDVTP